MRRPGTQTPPLEFRLIDGATWALHAQHPAALTLLSFRRGRFCRYCRGHLADLNTLVPDFNRRGVDVVTVSTDDAAEAQRLHDEEGFDRLTIGHGLRQTDIEACGLFASERVMDGVKVRFAEPALWLVRPGGQLYANFQSSMSCAPNDLQQLLEGIDILAEQNFPDRGCA
jgi:peroxiredoxin